jgi:hypothetical protein
LLHPVVSPFWLIFKVYADLAGWRIINSAHWRSHEIHSVSYVSGNTDDGVPRFRQYAGKPVQIGSPRLHK